MHSGSLKLYASCIILVAIVIRLFTNRYKQGLANIPGPTIAKYSSLWKLHNVWKGNHHQTALDLHCKHGSLVRIGPNHISVGDPSAIPIIYGLNTGFTKV
ncbi:Cytochrome P450 E-class group I [Penicillium coprophilum]|uniref:Cytochrome P450 E-class group I n=1 Tax=Penicillium coprophilum TaxID=36646 RepID=UPI0023988D6A|nr:Cytochrome P450 E-class group I [Penicillium coprophilum]KAJ5164780.1 Cytochrome P450 E-class group I [Penicillium coprophilum]